MRLVAYKEAQKWMMAEKAKVACQHQHSDETLTAQDMLHFLLTMFYEQPQCKTKHKPSYQHCQVVLAEPKNRHKFSCRKNRNN